MSDCQKQIPRLIQERDQARNLTSLRKIIPCQNKDCRTRLTACANCQVGPYCPSCQSQIPQLTAEGEKYRQWAQVSEMAGYKQLREIGAILGLPLQLPRNYKLSDPHWSNFFAPQVKNKWEQLRSTQLSPETQHSELLTENKQLTTALALKNRALKDLSAKIRALHSQLSEKEKEGVYSELSQNNAGWQRKINQLETKLNRFQKKLKEWSELIASKNKLYYSVNN